MVIPLLLLAFILLCRLFQPLADAYALHIYPLLSSLLSLVSSAVPFCLEEIIVLAFAAFFIWNIVKVFRKRNWKTFFLNEIRLLLWFVAWFYIGWGINYFRSPLHQRVEAPIARFDSEVFRSFLDSYTEDLNASYEESHSGSGSELSAKMMLKETKNLYSKVPERYGLATPRSWHRVKYPLLNRMYSGIGVLGFMGPFMAESQLNRDLQPMQFPFTQAHEYAHLLSVSNEAEANWWAYQVCSHSENPAVRYSAFFSVFSYVWNNARRVLSEQEFQEWRASVCPGVIDDANAEAEFWRSLRWDLLDRTQEFFYNLYLKGNGISSGMQNYSEVVTLILSVPSPFE